MALTLRVQGRLAEAEELEMRIIETRTRLLGPEHPGTPRSMVNLAYTWKAQGRDQDAIGLLRQAERLQRRGIVP